MKTLRNIKLIVVHCTLMNDTKNNEGYHYILRRDGEIIQPFEESKIIEGICDHDAECIHIAYDGGFDKEGKPSDTRNHMQREGMFGKLVELTERYPQAQILGHRDLSIEKITCPSFDVKEWLKDFIPDFEIAA